MNIRVGVEGWAGAMPAKDSGEVIAAHRIMWIEVDGHRISGSNLISVSGHWAGGSFHTTEVSFIGLPEFVLLGKDGEELT